MASLEHHERLLAALQSESDEAVVAAAEKLFALGQHGSPAGVYLLQGGKAALRLHRLADAARAIATADLAYSLALNGRPDEAERVLSTVPEVDDQRACFVLRCTTALVRYCQGRYHEALQAVMDG